MPATTAFTRTLYLVRHGAYAIRDKADAQAGGTLTPLGIAQAHLLATRLRAIPVHFSFMASSSMTRAEQTAAVIRETLPDVPISESASLRECTPDTSSAEASQCRTQIDAAFKTYFVPAKRSDESDILVAHGNIIRVLVTKALGIDAHAWLRMSVAHASLTIIRVNPDGSMVVQAVGDVGHIPANLQSWGKEGDPQLDNKPAPRP